MKISIPLFLIVSALTTANSVQAMEGPRKSMITPILFPETIQLPSKDVLEKSFTVLGFQAFIEITKIHEDYDNQKIAINDLLKSIWLNFNFYGQELHKQKRTFCGPRPKDIIKICLQNHTELIAPVCNLIDTGLD